MCKEVNPFVPMGVMTGKPTREQMRKIFAAYRAVGKLQQSVCPGSLVKKKSEILRPGTSFLRRREIIDWE